MAGLFVVSDKLSPKLTIVAKGCAKARKAAARKRSVKRADFNRANTPGACRCKRGLTRKKQAVWGGLFVAGGEDFVEVAETAGEIARDVEDEDAVLGGHLFVKLMERGGLDLENDGALDGLGGGGAGSGFEDAHFSKKLLGSQDSEFRLVGAAEILDNANGAASVE